MQLGSQLGFVMVLFTFFILFCETGSVGTASGLLKRTT